MSDELNEKMLNVLTDIRSYLRITSAVSSRPAAARVLDTKEKAFVYSKMDGKSSTYEIADATGVPQRTVGNWAEEFVKSGLASPPNEFFPSHRALFSLNELSVNLSLLKKRKEMRQASPLSSSPTLDNAIVSRAPGGETNG
jgi:hypothetical protein